MLSNKLTFSLVLVLMLAFAATSAFAQVVPVVPDASLPGANTFGVLSVGATITDPNPDTAGDILVDDAGITDGATVNQLSSIPDLADLLQFGGTIELTIAVNAKGAAAGTIKSDVAGAGVAGKITAAAAAKFNHRVVITEIMWGRNATTALPGGDSDSQWIELFNNGGALVTADALTLRFSSTSTGNDVGDVIITTADDTASADADETEYAVVVDKVSTINRFGGSWGPLGNSGNTGVLGVGQNAVPVASLVSMYRKINIRVDKNRYKYKDDKDSGPLDGLGSGIEAGSWAASTGRTNLSGNFIGSPGLIHSAAGGVLQTFAKSPGSFAATGVILNEIRNDTSDANLDWIELHYHVDVAATTAQVAQNIENWTVSIVTATKADDGTYSAPKDANLFSLPKHKLQPGEYLVVYNRDPGDTILAGGVNIEDVAAGTQINKGSSHLYVVRDKLDLPSDKKFLLLLRNGNDKVDTHEKLVDYAGNGFFSVDTATKNTNIHPFIAWDAPGDQEGIGDPSFTAGKGSWGRATGIKADGVYRPNSRADNRMHKDDWEDFGFIGAGYDRDVDPDAAPGTPGYANVDVNVVADDQDNAAKTTPYAFGGSVTISEVMYDAGPRWNLVQWIELYNSSMTETINLKGWTMEIRNKEDVESYVDSSFEFGNDEDDVYILPNQTLLLVSGTGANDVDNTRVYNLYQHHRRGLGLLARDSVLLSRTGFYLKLTAKVNEGGETKVSMVMDEGGNVMIEGAKRTVVWELPARDPAARQSLVRQYGTRAIDGTADASDDGTMAESWAQSDIAGAGLAYYGHRNDVGTPGFRLGGPLPVSLSSFRPLRDKATGDVVITWITQSELNNAGFNILRADSKDGEFKVINLQGIIAGHGTTSEKHVYTYTDKTAKPNVAYYYQIEDVSLNGNRTTLRTTHLRGNVNASGKLATTWSDLKLQK